MKCLVAISVSREWSETDFLMQLGTWQLPESWQVKFGFFRQFTAAERHNVALMESIYNYDRLIFMDTDQIYPPDYLIRMLAHDDDIITGLNVSRYYPFEPTIYTITGEQEYDNEITVPTFESMDISPDTNVQSCDMTGTGALMINPEMIKKSSISQPYFKDIYDNEGCRRLLCDDFYFCWQLYKAGIKISVDQSILVQHIAKIPVSIYNAYNMKRAWALINSGHGYWKDGVNAIQ